uniref:Uncharacterized protein n=1 Tax=Oryza glumipatula TaxID=40148 RepID=A0A0E0A9T7_9ORYZ
MEMTTTLSRCSVSKWGEGGDGMCDPLSPFCICPSHACTRASPPLHALSLGEERSSIRAFPVSLAREADLHERGQALAAMQATKHWATAPAHASQVRCNQPNTPIETHYAMNQQAQYPL